MATVCQAIKLTVPDKVGRLAEMTDKINEAGVNILAVCAWVEGEKGKLLAITDDNSKACAAVKADAEACSFEEGIVVQTANRPGALGEIAHRLADAGIAITLCYAAAGDAPQGPIVLHTSDNTRAAEIV